MIKGDYRITSSTVSNLVQAPERISRSALVEWGGGISGCWSGGVMEYWSLIVQESNAFYLGKSVDE
jgi:hypothetical protein